ncbi:MAG: 50S ribosomal protein L9 [Gemmatimonadetes bacterium]|nr:50S ribosomal protein L9 [Gemmatimonadota bacterium]NNM06498.1 50S ribosomal protein L9 [Gemmatimonadota bacterium]
MKLILRKTVENLGEPGEIVDVAPGFGRNFLLPQGLAYEASEANVRRLEDEKAQAEERARRDYLEAKRRAAQLDHMSLTFQARAGEDGKLFGSVTSGDIADRASQAGLDFKLEKKHVQLDEPLKVLGATKVTVRFHAEVEVEIDVNVEREEG